VIPLSLPYIFDQTLGDSSPGNGKLRLDQVSQLTARVLRAARIDSAGRNRSLELASIVPGALLRMTSTSRPACWLEFIALDSTELAAYRNIGLQLSDHAPLASPVATMATANHPRSIVISGNYAYLTNQTAGLVQVVDISNPLAPAVVASVAVANALGIAVDGQYLYVTQYESPNGYLRVIDVSVPTAPVVVGSVIVGFAPAGIAVAGTHVYIAVEMSDALKVVDVSVPTAPTIVGTVAISTYPLNLVVSGSYAYVTAFTGQALKVVDISIPTAPVVVGSVATGLLPYAVAYKDGVAYVTTYSGRTVQAIDVSVPTAPVVLKTVSLGTALTGMTIAGNGLYVTKNTLGQLALLDITDPLLMSVVGTIVVGPGPYTVAANDGYLYTPNYGNDTLTVSRIGVFDDGEALLLEAREALAAPGPSGGGERLTQADALAALRRTTDTNWLNGMLAQPDGAAIVNMQTAIAEAASAALMDQVEASMIATAPAGTPGQCDLLVWRPDSSASAAIPKGYRFVTSLGVDLVVATDVVVSVGQQVVRLPLVTTRQLDLVNTSEPAFGDAVLVGDSVDAICSPTNIPIYDSGGTPLLGPGFVSPMTYVASTPIYGAKMDWLSEHGNERDCRRMPGEDGEAYRARIRQLPDAVTPVAIQEAVHGAQAQLPLPTIYMVEPYRDQATDVARLALDLVFADSPAADVDYADDPLGVDLPGKLPWRTLENPSIREGRAYFRLGVAGSLREPDGSLLYCDDAGYCDDPRWGYPDISLHPAIEAALRAVLDEARRKRAGGVQSDLYVEDSQTLHGAATATGPGTATVWTLTPPSGKAWMLRQGLVTCDAGGAIDPTTNAYSVRLTLIDGSIILCISVARDGMPLRSFELERLYGYRNQLVTLIEGLTSNTAATTLNLVGTFWVTPIAL
jgi:hypothetical protein